jgi:hypothetical protein
MTRTRSASSYGGAAAAAAIFSLAMTGIAASAPILQQIGPVPTTYRFGVGGDFTQYPGTSLGDVTARVEAVGLTTPLVPSGLSASGCTAADFAGFGTFGEKAANAAAAGAAGALIFNNVETSALNFAFSVAAGIPTLLITFDVGNELATLAQTSPVEARIDVTSLDDGVAPPVASVAEPGSFGVLGAGLTIIGLGRRLRRKED